MIGAAMKLAPGTRDFDAPPADINQAHTPPASFYTDPAAV